MKSNQKGNHHQSTNVLHKSKNRCVKGDRSSREGLLCESLDSFEHDPVWRARLKAELRSSIHRQQKISVAVAQSDYATLFDLIGLLVSLLQNPQSPL